MHILSYPKFMTNKYIITEGIIVEDVYQMDIFNKIISLIFIYEHMFFSAEQIKDLLPFNWSGKKYIKSNKNLHVFNTSFNNITFEKNDILAKLSNKEKQQILKHSKQANGFFLDHFEKIDNSISIIFINSDIQNAFEFKQTLCHELIHYFQWNTGRSIYSIKQIEETNQKNLKTINQLFNVTLTSENIKNILNKHDLIPYTFQLFNYLKNKIKNKRLLKFVIGELFDSLQNNKEKDFEIFWNDLIHFKSIILDETKEILYEKNQKLLILILSSFYCIGFNTIKNHIYGYLNKGE